MSIDDLSMEQPALEEQAAQPMQQVQQAAPNFQIPEFLKAKTGEGSIENYINHPLNIKENVHLARVLRGLTGMFNALDYAIIDIIVGALGFMKKPTSPPASQMTL
jgi:hypothetical protein